ncbi:hypothetical protein AB6A40_002352 [Gnathostoma spinigerum]|uniref:G-protein coupled receptors family 1 profile domain-containing protein n=1 Tax=Gnathostoma spinigerum TaxID=75299 RepID=A0ABD6EFG2_9BILA
MSMDSFVDLELINSIDLSRTAISELPTNGLKKLENLRLEGTVNLKKMPPILAFTSLQNVEFTYPYHCCLFKHASKEIGLVGKEYEENLEEIRFRECAEQAEELKRKSLSSRYRRAFESFRHRRRRIPDESVENPLDFTEFLRWIDTASDVEILVEGDDDDDELQRNPFEADDIGRLITFNCTTSAVTDFFSSIKCSPTPDELNPCENVVGYQFLRWAIWFVWISAIIGNVGVWIVLATAWDRRMRVHYFFMANLSAADLFTGIYLGMLAVEDARTSDEYYNHAVEWQTGIGCQVAGFISVFASEISILSMFFIAFEMRYNTSNAFYGKRLKEKIAYGCMFGAYLFAFFMAILPIVGVSTYTRTSVCLPLSIEDSFDRGYLIFGLIFNLLAFFGMAVSYIQIVVMLRNPDQPRRSEDAAIVTKMAILVGTDMLCWFPTLFFGLTAAMNYPLINISVAKIFLVLFYPINAFMNPFLYVFFTKVVHKTVRPRAVSLLKRISVPSMVANDRTITSLSNFYHRFPPVQRIFKSEDSLLQKASASLVSVGSNRSICSNCEANRR